MQKSLWQKITCSGEQLCENQSSPLADGKVHGALEKVQLLYNWHTSMWSLEMFILEDDHLAFPIILGLDFLTKTKTIIDLGENKYGVWNQRKYLYLFFPLRLKPSEVIPGKQEHENMEQQPKYTSWP